MSDTGKIIALAKAVSKIDPTVIEESVSDWLDDHPEATTTVEDGSITKAKLHSSVHEYINDAYTYTANDVESGSWSYGTKSSNAKRLRNKVQIPVHKGMKVRFTNPTLQIDFAIYKVSGTYIQNTGWLSASSTEREVIFNTDGYLVILHQSTSNITVSDYDSTVKLYSYPTSKASAVEALASDAIFDMSDWNEMPVPVWEQGGLYGSTGIEYDSDSRIRTKFIPVKPGENLTILNNSEKTVILSQFASCVHSDTNVNNIVCTNTDVVGQMTIKLDNSAKYIRLQSAATLANVSGYVAVFHENYNNRIFNYTHTLVESEIINGSYSASTGAVTSSSTRIRNNGILYVEAGATVHFVPGETTTDFWCAYRSNTSETFSNYGWMTGEQTKTFDVPTYIILAFAKTDRTADISPEDFDCEVTVTTPVIVRSLKTYASLETLKNDTSVQIGQIVRTLGFSVPNDFGGGIYEAIYSASEPDNCVLFATVNDGVKLKRVFTDPFVYLESLNYANVNYSVINTVIQRNNITDVRCSTITTDKTIEIQNYDFSFCSITYTGNDCAILMDGVQCRKIYGNMLTADNAEFGLKMTCTSRDCVRNIIEIDQIKVKDHALAVRPVNSNGIMHNHYRVNYIRSFKTGFSCIIPSETNKYSWEGEELLTLNQITAANEQGTAVAVYLEVEPDPTTGETLDGTITGLTFTNLAFESSDNGVYIHCGEYSSHSTHLYNACIKSIIINNMRTREDGWTYNFLYGSGYIRDVYVKPTTVLRFSQVNLVSSVGTVPARIDCPVFYDSMMTHTGYGISSRLGYRYFTKRKGGVLTVADDVDFSVFGLNHSEEAGKTLFYPDEFYIADSVLGDSVHINLMYLMDESADGIVFSIPGKSGNNTATVEAEYMSPHKTITLTNNNAERHLYQVRLMQGRNWNTDWKFQIIDLGVADSEITLPYNYDEDN